MDQSEVKYDLPIIVVAGKHKGRIGYIDDEEMPYVYVRFDELTLGFKSCTKIHIKNVEPVRHQNLIDRITVLKDLIAREAAKNDPDYVKLFTLYEEYVYVSQLQTNYYINAFYSRPTIETKIFISCSKKDIILANNIATDLKMVGYDVFLYSISINLGENIIDAISENINKADILIPIISEHYNNSQFCKDELTSFYINHIKSKPNSILPIRINCASIPTIFAPYKYFDYEKSDYNGCITELLRSINKQYVIKNKRC